MLKNNRISQLLFVIEKVVMKMAIIKIGGSLSSSGSRNYNLNHCSPNYFHHNNCCHGHIPSYRLNSRYSYSNGVNRLSYQIKWISDNLLY
jgi:hypothetical protein